MEKLWRELGEKAAEVARLTVAHANAEKKLGVAEGHALEREATMKAAQTAEERAREEVKTTSKQLEQLRHELTRVQNSYEGGLPKEQTEKLQERARRLEEERNGYRAERDRYRDIADQAQEQTKQVLALRESHAEELNDARKRATELEATSDDHLIIGKLQRQLITTKTSYRAFVRKYESAVARARRKEITSRQLQEALDSKGNALNSVLEERRLQVGSVAPLLRRYK